MREVRILLVGDDGVGKSTLITSLIKETFVSTINHVVGEVTIPPEWTRENVTTKIVDSSSRPENKDQLETEIRKADVICIVYAINRHDTFERVSVHWLPYIRNLGRNVPVVLVGNKIDIRGKEITNDSLEEQIMPVMNEFKEVETCVECSAKQPLNVSEVFYFAQKAVLYPTAPLYDSREHILKPPCVDALRRIFKLCDIDKNGVLDDDEINEFQNKCFGAPLQKQELESVKAVVKESEPDGVIDQSLSEIGFLFLHTLFIQRGRLETTWTVLRTFGYGDDLSLREDFLFPEFEVPFDCSAELSSDGYQFLTDIFKSYDHDKDSALKDSELEELFSTTPGNPWEGTGFPETTVTNESGAVTLQGFLAQWSMTTLLDHKLTLSYLAYLGFPQDDTTTALKLTKPRKLDRKRGKGPTRCVFVLCVGCYWLWKVEIGGAEKYIVMQEFGHTFEAEVLQNKKRLDACDLLCFVYDSGDANSFTHVANLRKKYSLDHLPMVVVATKSDLDLVPQRYIPQPDEYCRTLRLAVPVSISIKDKVTADLFNMLAAVAIDPAVAIPGSTRRSDGVRATTIIATSALTIAVVAIAFGIWYRTSGKPSIPTPNLPNV
ncbi:hypothetical protein BASA61_003037 [Batrachochytrium salamandrivorans]|nr:hypothetical protein BASA61_003037 [Batrachochytrium salamandrivorans]